MSSAFFTLCFICDSVSHYHKSRDLLKRIFLSVSAFFFDTIRSTQLTSKT